MISLFIKQLIPSSTILILVLACNTHTNESIKDFEDKVKLNSLPKNTNNNDAIYFGFDLRASPQEDARQYLPFLEYLQESTGYQIKLKFTPTNSSIIDELGQGRIQFAAIGADAYLKAHEIYNVISLVRGKNQLSKASYRSMIIISPDSEIKTIEDIKNKRFAFGNINSTQGHLIPRIIMSENNITLNDLAKYKYTGSHRNCANAVITKKYDACGLQDTMALALSKKNQVRIIHTSRYYPSSGIAANANVDKKILNNILNALIEFDPIDKHKSNLYNWQKTEMPKGFETAKSSDYEELREWSIKLGMLTPSHNRIDLER